MHLHQLLSCVVILASLEDIIRPVAGDLCSQGNETMPEPTASSTRRKRSLTFPKGSAFVLTLTLLKAIQLKEPANWNLDLEFDMIWPIPQGRLSPPRKPWPRRRIQQSWQPHRRHRRELYSNLKLAMDSQGLPGNQCILRTICEAKLILNPPGISLVEDVLRVVFSYPASGTSTYDAYDNAYSNNDDCYARYPCPLSLLDLLLNYHNDISNYK